MLTQRLMLFGAGTSLAALLVMPLFSPRPATHAQQMETSSLDVCPPGWYRFNCTGVRLCVSPAINNFYGANTRDAAAMAIYGAAPEHDGKGACIEDSLSVPEAYTHATQQQLSFYAGYYDIVETPMFMKVVKIDSGDFSSERNFHQALERFTASFKDTEAHDSDAFRAGEEARQAVVNAVLTDGQIPSPKAAPNRSSTSDICPAGWARFGCQFARLCIAPDVASKYATWSGGTLEKSGQFYFAKCKADDKTVPAENTHSSPYEVGFAAGFRLFDTPKYFKVVKLDSSGVSENNEDWHQRGINAALERLGLSLLPPSAVMEYARGWREGHAEFQGFLNKVKKAGESEGTQKPN